MLSNAWAAVTCTKTTQNPSGWVDTTTNNNCVSGNTTKYYIMTPSLQDVIRSCSSCVSGAKLVPISSSTNSALFAVCSNASSLASGLYTCVTEKCESESGQKDYSARMDCEYAKEYMTQNNWTSVTTGYEKRTKYTWSTTTCICSESVIYRCAAGYYQAAQITCTGTSCSGCASCGTTAFTKTDGTKVYPTSAAGSTAQLACYYPTGTYKDDKGIYEITSNCYYK